MSNSIWHDKNEKPVKVLYKNYIIITKWGSVLGESDVDSGYTIETDWAYLEDIIAQADKAERLEKENEAMREEFEVWHGNYKCEVEEKKQLQKDLEIAQKALEDITKVRCGLEDFEPKAVTMTRIAENALEQISINRN